MCLYTFNILIGTYNLTVFKEDYIDCEQCLIEMWRASPELVILNPSPKRSRAQFFTSGFRSGAWDQSKTFIYPQMEQRKEKLSRCYLRNKFFKSALRSPKNPFERETRNYRWDIKTSILSDYEVLACTGLITQKTSGK